MKDYILHPSLDKIGEIVKITTKPNGTIIEDRKDGWHINSSIQHEQLGEFLVTPDEKYRVYAGDVATYCYKFASEEIAFQHLLSYNLLTIQEEEHDQS